MDTTTSWVALPSWATTWRRRQHAQWVVTGYLLSLAIWIPASGDGDRFGTEEDLSIRAGRFRTGSALCGRRLEHAIADCLPRPPGSRRRMVTPVGTTMLFRAFSAQERAALRRLCSRCQPRSHPRSARSWRLARGHASWRWDFSTSTYPSASRRLSSRCCSLPSTPSRAAGRFDLWGFLAPLVDSRWYLCPFAAPTVWLDSMPVLRQPASLDWCFSPCGRDRSWAGRIRCSICGSSAIDVPQRKPRHVHRLWRAFRRALPAATVLQQLRGLSAFRRGLDDFPRRSG